MEIEFKNSKTKENLMRAFAGESQARNRYTIAAEQAREQGLYAVSNVFLFTADQERAHAQRFYELLGECAGETIEIDGGYPVDIANKTESLLEMARHNEYEEYEEVYPAFAEIAKEEGFFEAASAFLQIAEIEKTHGKRFEELAELLKNGVYFEAPEEEKWMCLNCGHIHIGKRVPELCPVCRHPKGFFIPLGLAPYTGGIV